MTSERCGRCGMAKESSMHQIDSNNVEIRMASHPFEPDDYVAWLRWTGDQDHRRLAVCDSDDAGAFRVYRRSK